MAELNVEKIEQFIYYFASQKTSWKEVVGEIPKRFAGIKNIECALFDNPNFRNCAENYGNNYFNSCKLQLTKISNEIVFKPENSTVNKFKM